MRRFRIYRRTIRFARLDGGQATAQSGACVLLGNYLPGTVPRLRVQRYGKKFDQKQ